MPSPIQKMPTPEPRFRIFASVLEVMVVVVAIGAGVVWYMWTLNHPQTTSTKNLWSTYETVQKNNVDFSQGESLLAQKKYAEAEAKFVSALPGAHNAAEEAEIAYKVAQSVASSGDYLRAVTLYKGIAENTSYPRIVRAYAIQNMGQLFVRYLDPKITEAIFSTEPYKTARAGNDDNLSYRRLNEYAATLYPLTMAELMIADWYSRQILAAVDTKKPLDADTLASYKKNITERLALADTDIARITDSPEQVSLPAMLARKAVVIGRMQITGDASFGDAEAIFQQSLNLARATNTQYQDGLTRYFYGLFLARTGKEASVSAVLAPLYSDPAYKGSVAERFFADERNDVSETRKGLPLLAQADPKFKAYLMSLGWTAADFK